MIEKEVKLINMYDLLEKLTVNSDGKRIPETDCDNFPVMISLREIKELIRDLSTYDVNSIIKDLSLEKEYELTGIYNSDLEHRMAEERMWDKNETIDECIEIVKRGFKL